MIIKLRKEHIFLLLFAVSAFGKLQANLDVPYFNNDYIYIFYTLSASGFVLWTIYKNAFKIKISRLLFCLLWITGYIFLWGFVFIDPAYSKEIYNNALKLLVMTAFVFSTAYIVKYFNIFIVFLKTLYFTQAFFVLQAVIVNFSEIFETDWLGNIMSMTSGGTRLKLGFGMHGNILGMVILITLANGLILNEYVSFKLKRIIYICDFFMFIILIMSASRMPLICVIIMYLIPTVYKRIWSYSVKIISIMKCSMIFAVLLFIFICFNTEYFKDILMKFNRYYAVNDYSNLFFVYGDYLTGIGLVNFGRMLPSILVDYGFKYTLSECTWIDIIVTTGFLGAAWIFIFYSSLFKGILKSSLLNTQYKRVVTMTVFCCVLLMSVAENVGVTDAYWISFSFLTLLLCFTAYDKKNESMKAYIKSTNADVIYILKN